jgi:hypothetical protein
MEVVEHVRIEHSRDAIIDCRLLSEAEQVLLWPESVDPDRKFLAIFSPSHHVGSRNESEALPQFLRVVVASTLQPQGREAMCACVMFEPIRKSVSHSTTTVFLSDAQMYNDRGIEPALEAERKITDYPLSVIDGNRESLLRHAVVKCAPREQTKCASVRSPDRDHVIETSVAGGKLDNFPRHGIDRSTRS